MLGFLGQINSLEPAIESFLVCCAKSRHGTNFTLPLFILNDDEDDFAAFFVKKSVQRRPSCEGKRAALLSLILNK